MLVSVGGVYVLQEAATMSSKARDFYHIQDQISLAWSYASGKRRWRDLELEVLSNRISEISDKIKPTSADVVTFIELTNKKIQLLESALESTLAEQEAPQQHDSQIKQTVEVSLSSSGMGFFSEKHAEEDSQLELELTLPTVNQDIRMSATVLECRSSADSENPGYWIRVRFSRDQEHEVDQLLAHVTQRQIEKLQRKSSNAQGDSPETVRA
jgi:hypothetical protein